MGEELERLARQGYSLVGSKGYFDILYLSIHEHEG